MIHGSDISHHQGMVDFDALRTATEFVIVKATEGVGYEDPAFRRNWTEAKRVGLVRGAYHFARPDLGNGAEKEADYFLSRVPMEVGDLLVLDAEDAPNRPRYGHWATWAHEFLMRCESAVGFKPLIYLNLDFIRRYRFEGVVSSGYGLWLARWDHDPDAPRPATPWPFVAMRQWTSSGSLPGVSGRVDRNVFYGSREQLRLYGKPDEPPVPEDAFERRWMEMYNKVGAAQTFDDIKAVQGQQAETFARHTHGEPQ